MRGAVADGSRLERRYRRRAGAAAVRSGGDGAITDRVAVCGAGGRDQSGARARGSGDHNIAPKAYLSVALVEPSDWSCASGEAAHGARSGG